MIPAITPDLSFNIVHTIYALFIHNYIVFAYFLGLLLSIFLSIKNPSRYTVFLILGFALLLFSFEYDKHIAEGLRDQTLQSLITTKSHYTVQKWVNLVIAEILPILFFSGGWLFVFISLILGSKKNK